MINFFLKLGGKNYKNFKKLLAPSHPRVYRPMVVG